MKQSSGRKIRVTRRQAVQLSLNSLALAAIVRTAHGAPSSDTPATNPADGVCLTSFDQIEPVKFPSGWIRWLMNAKIDPNAEMTIGIVELNAHTANPLHIHPNSAEFLHVLSGSCKHRVGAKWVSLKAGDTVRIPKGVIHGARTADEPMRAMIVYDTGTRIMVPVDEKGTPKN